MRAWRGLHETRLFDRLIKLSYSWIAADHALELFLVQRGQTMGGIRRTLAIAFVWSNKIPPNSLSRRCRFVAVSFDRSN
jgi:hypothetical protein